METGLLFPSNLSDPLESLAFARTLEALRVGPSDNPTDAEIVATVEACVEDAIREHADLARSVRAREQTEPTRPTIVRNVAAAVFGLRDAHYLAATEAEGNA
jgi:hypothetical protein